VTSSRQVFAGIYPVESNDFPKLGRIYKEGTVVRRIQCVTTYNFVRQLTLTDRSVTVQRESSAALGQGCRLGFLGSLHMDVFRQRLEDEHDANIVVTAPTVPYKGLPSDQWS
jgi:translation elongation factor EF-4